MRTRLRTSLRRAEQLKLASIALPALATGVGAFPVEECAKTMIGALREYARENPQSSLGLVRFVMFGAADYKLFAETTEKPGRR